MNGTPSLPSLPAGDAGALAGLETPCYLFDPRVVAEDLQALRGQLGTPVVVSVKASPVLDLLVRCNQDFTDGIEIASLGELNLTIGRMSVPRFINTPALDATLVAAGLACHATIVADGPQQIALVEAAHDEARRKRPTAATAAAPAGIVLRINAASLLERSGPAADHFGMDVATVEREFARLAAHPAGPQPIGVHVFNGSHSFAASGNDIAQRLAGLVAGLRRHAGTTLQFALIGAGIAADWRDTDLDFASYRQSLRDLQGQVRVMHEAGRAVFSRSGRFAARVVAVKQLNGESVVVCDGGMAHCFPLAQTEQFVKRWRQPTLLKAATARAAAAGDGVRTHTVVGNSCNRADVIGRLRSAAAPEPGDTLVFEHCGAYHSYSPTGFLNLRPARRYLVS